MAVLNDHELYVVTNSAMYTGLSMCGSEVYTDKAEADAAMAEQKKTNHMSVASGFKFEVMTLDRFVSEYAQERYYEGQRSERDAQSGY